MYNNNDSNRQWNPGQYKNFNLGQFQNRNKLYENRFLQNNNTQQNSNYTEIICNYCKKTPPMPVPSPDEKGGGGTQTAT